MESIYKLAYLFVHFVYHAVPTSFWCLVYVIFHELCVVNLLLLSDNCKFLYNDDYEFYVYLLVKYIVTKMASKIAGAATTNNPCIVMPVSM